MGIFYPLPISAFLTVRLRRFIVFSPYSHFGGRKQASRAATEKILGSEPKRHVGCWYHCPGAWSNAQCPAWGERGSDTVRLGLSCFLGTLWPWRMEMLPKCNAVSARSAKKTALAAHNGREIRFCFAFLELPRVCIRIQSLGSLCPVPDHQVTSRGTKSPVPGHLQGEKKRYPGTSLGIAP